MKKVVDNFIAANRNEKDILTTKFEARDKVRRGRKAFSIAGESIDPGTRGTIDIAAAKLYNRNELFMNIHVVHGKSDGPVLFVSGAVHGDEINGVEIIRRLLKLKLLNSLRGTLIAVPVVNSFGFVNRSRYLPDRRDLNRFFPGSPTGSLTGQLASIFMEEVVLRSTHGIDFHTGANMRSNLPQIRAVVSDPKVKEMAMAFGAPVVLDAELRDGSLRSAAYDKNIPMLLFEGGQSMRFDQIPIRVGVQGVISVMRYLGMLPKAKTHSKRIPSVLAKSSTWARASSSGVFLPRVNLGDIINKKQVIGIVTDPLGEHEHQILSPASGIVIGQLQSPLVHKGDAVSHVASISDMDIAENALDSFQREFEIESKLQQYEEGYL
ncbi:succinylglutamate desuccinylase/aspartoacylase family protein [Maridesulfovibrio zosterae]|uniref:succinylglutamate desuccinylase/aspartoacylase family protein n=1 Tax=Maridesulfovibrio zosterae TaxID=82171 RepID=UPI00041596B3|nr:succinylglutamate desuccinylase/aspartoacylase family protein [Maridesulfovibrio zosterae]